MCLIQKNCRRLLSLQNLTRLGPWSLSTGNSCNLLFLPKICCNSVYNKRYSSELSSTPAIKPNGNEMFLITLGSKIAKVQSNSK